MVTSRLAEALTNQLNEWLYKQTDNIKWQTGYQKVKSNTILVYSLPMTKLLQPCMLSCSFMGASVDGIARTPLVPRLGISSSRSCKQLKPLLHSCIWRQLITVTVDPFGTNLTSTMRIWFLMHMCGPNFELCMYGPDFWPCMHGLDFWLHTTVCWPTSDFT